MWLKWNTQEIAAACPQPFRTRQHIYLQNQSQQRKNWVLIQQFNAAPFTYAYLLTKQNYPAI